MLKLIQTEPFSPYGEPTVSVVDMDNTLGFIKKASINSEIAQFISGIKPDPKRVYLHILALTAGDFYGKNRNADIMTSDALRKYHNTFVTTPALIHRNHQNKFPEKAIGQVIFSVYNEAMHRVEIIAWIDVDKAADIVERLNNGEYPATSMALRTEYDECTLCGTKARNSDQRCSCILNDLGKILPDGRQVAMLNSAPLKFIEESFVFRPADVNSSVLQKVAFEGQTGLRSDELAELEGLKESDYDDIITKASSLKKLSEFIKEVEGTVIDASENLDDILAKVRDPNEDSIDILRNYKLNDVFSTMADLGISPSIGFLAELVARKVLGSKGLGMGQLVADYFEEHGIDAFPMAEKDYGEVAPMNPVLLSALMPSVKQASLYPQFVEERQFGTYAPGTNVGYAGNGPKIEETPYEKLRRAMIEPASKQHGGLTDVLKTLTIIGGAALAAKMFITSIIEKKMLEAEMQRHHNEVKISLVKSASDYRSTYHLAKSAMIKLCQKKK
jgi:hypothetical protein